MGMRYNLVKCEFVLCFKECIRYKISLLSDFIIFTFTYIAIYFFGATSGFIQIYNINKSSGQILILIGYIFWQLNSTALGYSSSSIQGDARKGILELRLQSKFSITLVLFIQMIVYMMFSILTMLGIVIFTCFMGDFKFDDLQIILVSYFISIPSIIGMFGIGLIIGGITLIEKNVGQFIFILQTALLFVSNTLSPTRSEIVNLLPFTYGISITRGLFLNMQIPAMTVVLYILVNFIWLFIGVIFFNCLLKHEKRVGVLDNY